MKKDESIKKTMCRGTRRAKMLCAVLIMLEAICAAASVVPEFASVFHLDTGVSLTAIVVLMLVRWAFDALESIIMLLCPRETNGSRLPEAAFSQDTRNRSSDSAVHSDTTESKPGVYNAQAEADIYRRSQNKSEGAWSKYENEPEKPEKMDVEDAMRIARKLTR